MSQWPTLAACGVAVFILALAVFDASAPGPLPSVTGGGGTSASPGPQSGSKRIAPRGASPVRPDGGDLTERPVRWAVSHEAFAASTRRWAEPGPQDLVGRLVDAYGAAVEGAEVRAYSERMAAVHHRGGSSPNWVAETDADGRFFFPRERSQGWWLVGHARGFPPASPNPLRWEPGEPAPRLVLTRGGWLHGELANRATGRPIELAPLDFTLELEGRGECRFAFTLDRAKGRFRVGPCPAGSYALTLEAHGRLAIVRRGVIVADETETDLGTLLFDSGCALQVDLQVLPPVEAERVKLYLYRDVAEGADWARGTVAKPATARLDRRGQGAASFAGLAPGTYTLLVRANACATWLRHGLEVSAGPATRVEVRLSAAAWGRIRLCDSGGAPVTGVRVEVEQAPGLWIANYWDARGQFVVLRADAEGRVPPVPLAPGTWRVRAIRLVDGRTQGSWIPIGTTRVVQGENHEALLTLPR